MALRADPAGDAVAFRFQRIYPLMLAQPGTHAQGWEARNRDFHAALESARGSPWLLHFNAVACGRLRHEIAENVVRVRQRMCDPGHARARRR